MSLLVRAEADGEGAPAGGAAGPGRAGPRGVCAPLLALTPQERRGGGVACCPWFCGVFFLEICRSRSEAHRMLCHYVPLLSGVTSGLCSLRGARLPLGQPTGAKMC